MSNMDKMQAFIAAKIAGIADRDAGLQAGYSPQGIAQTVSRLKMREDVKLAIARGKRGKGKNKPEESFDDDKPKMKDKYESSLALMQDAYNNPKLPYGVRFEAAKQALPYEHGRVGEKGKKETAKDRAKEVGAQKFKTTAPPQLKLVK